MISNFFNVLVLDKKSGDSGDILETNVLKNRHSSILKNIGERLMWCELSGERYWYYIDPYGTRSYLDCQSNNGEKVFHLHIIIEQFTKIHMVH